MLNDTFTSTGHKFFAHEEAMTKLRNGQGQPIVTHVMLTDVCNHKCAFCSVQHRAGDSLAFDDVMEYLDTLIRYGLKAVILSGGGNPILYKRDGKDFNDVVDAIHAKGLQIGLITNGMPLVKFPRTDDGPLTLHSGTFTDKVNRKSWRSVWPATLDKLTWIRISMSGLDHAENEVYVPDIDPTKTTLGFSYVAHDIYDAPEDKAHGKVSTEADVLQLGSLANRHIRRFEDRIDELSAAFVSYCQAYNPRYLRLLPNCLEPKLIAARCEQLNEMARLANFALDREVLFIQQKPPKAPHACFLGYVHPVLNCDGYVYPCDSCVLNETAGHTFANPWRICHWSEIAAMYDSPVTSLVDPQKLCPGCVFTRSNEILEAVVNGATTVAPLFPPEHVNFV